MSQPHVCVAVPSRYVKAAQAAYCARVGRGRLRDVVVVLSAVKLRARTLLLGLPVLLSAGSARALDLPTVKDKPVTLDVTETTILAQHFNARADEGELPQDQGYGTWINRLNTALKWDHFTLGLRLDSSVYWARPEDRTYTDVRDKRNAISDGSSRFRDAIYPSKIWLTYKAPGIEVVAGDAYVQFGRGLTLSARKIDELGIDTTVRGGKVQIQKDPIALTLVAGLMNPNRFEDAQGRSLLMPKKISFEPSSPQPMFGSDRVVGAEIQAGRGGPVILSTRAVRFTRCAPFQYDALGNTKYDKGLQDGSANFLSSLDSPMGSCDPVDSQSWLSSLPNGISPNIRSSEVVLGGQSLEIPNLFGVGNLYVEGAIMRYEGQSAQSKNTEGTALYGSFTTKTGFITHTLEGKSYHNYYPVQAAVDATRAIQFANVTYTSQPTTELITQDSMFGFFNGCVDGGRMRSDARLRKNFLLYGAVGYYISKNEEVGGGCDRFGKSLSKNPDDVTTQIWDVMTGLEWRFDADRSYLFASTGVRDDEKFSGFAYYREKHVEYTFTKHLFNQYSLELTGRHRIRWQEGENKRDDAEAEWHEGENYTAFKIAPKWVLSHGFEYTTRVGAPTYYNNGSLLYRITESSNLKVLVGQQRGGIKCVSGVCRNFPPFEGARAELTMRF